MNDCAGKTRRADSQPSVTLRGLWNMASWPSLPLYDPESRYSQHCPSEILLPGLYRPLSDAEEYRMIVKNCAKTSRDSKSLPEQVSVCPLVQHKLLTQEETVRLIIDSSLCIQEDVQRCPSAPMRTIYSNFLVVRRRLVFAEYRLSGILSLETVFHYNQMIQIYSPSIKEMLH
ncbi:unnamed protein product [Nesidiocoris tenuis]|uniref:Uncharacterized protein n=1 Tax=Nesidiocoris tenuis TaxID=355587 RepID=A0A6H5H189_9HEMI|nr:unnamed protein product [Nesidiocoris tenuis]